MLRLQAYAHWTYDMARLQPSQARLDEADKVHERAIELAELSSTPLLIYDVYVYHGGAGAVQQTVISYLLLCRMLQYYCAG